MEDTNKIKKSLEILAQRQLPRILTQFCRDPHNPSYGCADRNWWHYKIRDFPSIILQQAGLTIKTATELSCFKSYKLHNLIESSVLFWNKRVNKYGAFEEYYPWEKGYPPLAFSTLAILLVIKDSNIDSQRIFSGVKKASYQLINRFENQAANQQIAGLAALSWIRNIYPGLVSEKKFNEISHKSLELQDEEGWFEEYGGPDLGYLSVTLDCLWDLFDATKEEKYFAAAVKSLNYFSSIIKWTGGESIGMHNSRNTDYIVPYGFSRFLSCQNNLSNEANLILQKVFSNSHANNHFYSGIDDRYWCHYIGTSLLRSLKFIPEENLLTKREECIGDFQCFENAGYFWVKRKEYNILITPKKGGIISTFLGKKRINNYGWILKDNKKELINHFWSKNWEYSYKKNINYFELNIKGSLFPHKQIISNPFKHIILRILSFTFGKKIIRFLKAKFIFKRERNTNDFSRNVKIYKNKITIIDTIVKNQNSKIILAPRFSKRHVSSADSFNKDDLLGTNFDNKIMKSINNNNQITTEYSF